LPNVINITTHAYLKNKNIISNENPLKLKAIANCAIHSLQITWTYVEIGKYMPFFTDIGKHTLSIDRHQHCNQVSFRGKNGEKDAHR
jgi:hypothetical protein